MQSQPELSNGDTRPMPREQQSVFARYLRRYIYAFTILATVLIAAEVMARLQDWISRGEDPFASPTFDEQLYRAYATGTRGRPFGKFECCQLNQFGFRGPEMEETPTGGS